MKIFKLLHSKKIPAICKCGENDYIIPKINSTQLPLKVGRNISIDTECNNCKRRKLFRLTASELYIEN